MSNEKTVAFIGLGAMGWGIAANLAAAAARGDVASPVTVWNRTSAKAERHAAAFGTRCARTLSDVSRADVIGREHLLIRVMDRDTHSNDDLIGSARLYLGDFGDAIKEEKSGKIEKLIQLTNKGRRAGEMMLSLVLEKNPNYAA